MCNKLSHTIFFILCNLFLATNTIADNATEISGYLSLELRGFPNQGLHKNQKYENVSLAFQPEFYKTWSDETHSILLVPFARLDQHDSRRTHVDVREFIYNYNSTSWEFRAGLGKVFWGVAESNHLIDIINQTDAVENIDQEDKLGQPMINLTLVRSWGVADFFVLPGFRERSFPDKDARFRSDIKIDQSSAMYQSAAEEKHIDYAVRFSSYLGPLDVGLSHFWGTSRMPRFLARSAVQGELSLIPYYDLIHQTSLDLQATLQSWLLKLEVMRRQGQDKTYFASVSGFEYTVVGIGESSIDVGLLGEYHWDERGFSSPGAFNNDVFAGMRIAVNDAADSQLLGGIAVDMNNGGYFLNVETSRRFGNHWKLELEARFTYDTARHDAFYPFRKDDSIQLEIIRFF
jgi:hypothetical protein